MELHYQGVLERKRLLPFQRSRAAPPATEGHGYFKEREATRSFPIPKEGLGLGKFLDMPYELYARLSFSYLTKLSFVLFVQAIQKVFMAEEWVKDTRNKARFADNLRAETSKALGTVEERRRKSVEADLKNA